jgi:uncharacterized membrane protein YfcA
MPMTMMLALAVTMLTTAFLSGIFGMAGGLVLIGILLVILPLPEAMTLHAITQMASNGWRGLLWLRYVRWRAVVAFLSGGALAFLVWTFWRYVPEKPIAYLLLGVSPFLVRVVPAELRPDPERLMHGLIYGSACMMLMLLSGVAGPLVDSYFLGGKLDRREIVATKGICQIVSHGLKLMYFGGLVEEAAGLDPLMAGIAIVVSIIGASLARPVLQGLSDAQFRTAANVIIMTIAIYYLAHGSYLLLLPFIQAS